MTGDMQKVVYALKIRYNSIINTCNVQQCVTRLNQTVLLMCVCGGGGGGGGGRGQLLAQTVPSTP